MRKVEQAIVTGHPLDQRNRFRRQALWLRLHRHARLQLPEQPKTVSVPAQQRVRPSQADPAGASPALAGGARVDRLHLVHSRVTEDKDDFSAARASRRAPSRLPVESPMAYSPRTFSVPDGVIV